MMKTRKLIAGSIAALLTLVAVGGCNLQSDEEHHKDVAPLRSPDGPDDPNIESIYNWYLQQGQDPCDPPPDPWHPFVKQGLCPLISE